MPWEVTDDYIRSGHGSRDCDRMRTKTLSAEKGIKAIICFKGGSSSIQSYLFVRAKGWTLSTAKAWFKSHREEAEEQLFTYALEKLNPNAHADFTQYYHDFVDLFGEEIGDKKYYDMIASYGLDDTKSYGSQLTRECLNGVCESFGWATPLIQYLKKDDEAKYYKVRALTATLSANRNDYTNLEELERSARTLTWRPLNLNHDPNQYLPFPANRVDWAEYEDKAVEAIIRIHNAQEHIQQAIENGDIVNPSIEGEPRGGNVTEDGRKVPKWYNFTALALLEKDVTLPGVPSTYGFEPLFLNESLGRSLVESLRLENETGYEKEMTEEKEETLGVQLATGDREELVEQGLYGIEVCGQCKFFIERKNTTVTSPASTGDPGADGEVSTTTGAVGKGIGTCQMDEELKQYDNSACTSARPRESTTKINEEEKGRETKIESMNELTMKTQIAELEAELLRITSERNKEIETNIKTATKLSESENRLARMKKELTIVQENEVRHKNDILELREKNEVLKRDSIRFQVQVDGLEKDLDLSNGRVKSLEEGVERLETTLAESQEEKRRALNKANDEIEKRVQAQQRSRTAEDERIRAVREASEALEKLSARTGELSESTTMRSEAAKREFVLQKENEELRKKDIELTAVIRGLKRKLSKMPREIIIEG